MANGNFYLSYLMAWFDFQHHDSRSYQGITCLMQISTGKSDYIVDTLKLWDQLQPLNQVFCNPKILKVASVKKVITVDNTKKSCT